MAALRPEPPLALRSLPAPFIPNTSPPHRVPRHPLSSTLQRLTSRSPLAVPRYCQPMSVKRMPPTRIQPDDTVSAANSRPAQQTRWDVRGLSGCGYMLAEKMVLVAWACAGNNAMHGLQVGSGWKIGFPQEQAVSASCLQVPSARAHQRLAAGPGTGPARRSRRRCR